MKCAIDLRLKCTDCEKVFSSAGLLLHHFAQHVASEQSKHGGVSNKRKISQVAKFCQKRKTESVMTWHSPSSSTSSSTISVSSVSVKPETNSDSSSLFEPRLLDASPSSSGEWKEKSDTDNDDLQLSNQFPVRLDVQKLLENRVLNLNHNDDCSLQNKTSLSVTLNDANVTVQKDTEDSVSSRDSYSLNDVQEDFSPLTFCVTTMDSYKENKGDKKKVSSRKQLQPKKIERSLDGCLRKIAPRPENVPRGEGEPLLVCLKTASPKKKYPCHLCSKIFGWSTDLKRHILVHTGERPFKCKKCLASFTRNFLLQKHLSKVHPCNSPTKEELELSLNESVVANLQQLKKSMLEISQTDKTNCASTEGKQNEDPSNLPIVFATCDDNWLVKPKSDHRCSSLEHTDNNRFTLGKFNAVTT